MKHLLIRGEDSLTILWLYVAMNKALVVAVLQRHRQTSRYLSEDFLCHGPSAEHPNEKIEGEIIFVHVHMQFHPIRIEGDVIVP
jgi:hypothetical protein